MSIPLLPTPKLRKKSSELKQASSSSKMTTTYSLDELPMSFDDDAPTKNSTFNVRVVHPCASHPPKGTDLKQKVIDILSKNQYSKFNKRKSGLNSVEHVEQSQNITKTIRNLEMVWEKFDFFQVFDIVFLLDPTLIWVALKLIADGTQDAPGS